jgi:hypothetical protein|tara:strand:+ start:230 stop:640 length:411 start_codon:yes stop_codon:yes gene_type:complete
MAHEDKRIASYSQFGNGQFVDEFEREYRTENSSTQDSDLLPSSSEALTSAKNISFVIRVKKRSTQERMRRIKDTLLRNTITFPRTGETIVLKRSTKLLKLQKGSAESTETHKFKVVAVKPRGLNASTALIVAFHTT